MLKLVVPKSSYSTTFPFTGVHKTPSVLSFSGSPTKNVTKVLRLWLQNPFSRSYTQPKCTRPMLAALTGSVAKVIGNAQRLELCGRGLNSILATSTSAPEVCLCRPGAWGRVRKCSPGGGFAGKLLRLGHFLFPSNNRKSAELGYSWLVSAAPFLLYLLPSPPSSFPVSLPSHPWDPWWSVRVWERESPPQPPPGAHGCS